MAIQPLWLQNVDYPARWDRITFDNIWTDGILGSGSFAVSQSSPAAMTVQAAAGVAVIEGTDQAFQGKYLVREEAATTGLVIGAAPGSGQRNDFVVIQVRDPNAGGAAGDDAIVTVIAGPDSAGTDPTPPDSSLVLARVRVAAGTGSITNAMIDDLRSLAALAHPIVDSAAIIDGTIVSSDIATGGVATSNIADNATTDAKLRDSAALSVIGRASNSSGDPADIVAASDGQVLKRASNALTFAQVASTDIAAGAVTTSALAAGAVDSNALGTGAVVEGSIASNAVTNTKLRDSAALSVIGRSANSTGDPADISAGTDGHILRRSGTSLGFGTIATAGIGDGAVTNAKLRDSAGLSVIGRSASTTGDVADITAGTDGFVLRRSGTSLGFGTVATAGIADSAVTNAKISAVDAGKITTGTLGIARGGTGGTTALAALTNIGGYGKGTGAPAGFRITIASSAPSSPGNGDIWLKP